MNTELKYGFKLLKMLSDEGKAVENLIQLKYKDDSLDFSKYSDPYYSFDQVIALENAAKFKVDFVYFRHFPERPEASLPQIYVYDYTKKAFNEDEIKEMHRRLWSAVQVPMFFVFLENEIKIFNCLQAPIKNGKIVCKPLETIDLASRAQDLIKEFSVKRIDNGSFWENSRFATQFRSKNGAYERLLAELKHTLKDILKHKILPPKLAKKLLVKSILVKYLEEKKDERGNTVFPKAGDIRAFKDRNMQKGNFFETFVQGASSFVDILNTKGACVDFFNNLSKHFNGEIFKFEESELKVLKNTDLSRFAYFFNKKLSGKSNQLVLWDLYSFEDLPIELISNIYEEFLDKKAGVVYTPPYFVNFLLDEAMPLSNLSTDFKVIDPSCGSGVFLVGAYKRLIYKWRADNNWVKPGIKTLKQLLNDNIFGVDISEEAVNLSVFSLSLALCEELSPLAIWDELRFDNLKNKNLFVKDFFELIENEGLKADFDLVIGNPPFEPKLTKSAERIENRRKTERTINKEDKEASVAIAGNQIALLFLDQAIGLCNKKGLLCMILPASDFLYNNNSSKYRSWFFQNYHAFQVIDFTNLSRSLFGSANVSVVSLFSRNHKPENLEAVTHITVRRNYIAEEKLFFELDYYDFHKIPYDNSISKNFVWKANLFGGGRLARLLIKLNNFETIGTFLKNKMKNNGWEYGEGFQIGSREKITLRERYEANNLREDELSKGELKKLLKDYKKADWITKKDFLDEEAFTTEGIHWSSVKPIDCTYFYRNKSSVKNIFKGPHVLIKEVISNHVIPVVMTDQDLTFSHCIIGIYAPENEKNQLKKFYNFFKDNATYVFYTACLSATFSVNKATVIQKKDIDRLPFPHTELKKLKLSGVEKVLQDDTINYLLDYATGKKHNLALFANATFQNLEKFGKTYCDLLNSIYDDFHPHQPIETETFICFPFFMGQRPDIEIPSVNNLEQHLSQLLINNNSSTNLRIIRILRLYERNVVYLIKPKQLRYWLPSVAIRDADDTFADFLIQEYKL